MLATSRAPLRISGEVEYPLDPLNPTDAVALFVERARAVGRDIERRTRPSRLICRRLDSLPLAIELAAARVTAPRPRSAARTARAALPLLTGGSRDAPERQRTLRATIEWSYDLLDDERRRLLRAARRVRGNLSRSRRLSRSAKRQLERTRGARRPQPAQADRRRPPSHARDDPRVRTGAPRRVRRGRDVSHVVTRRSSRGSPRTPTSIAIRPRRNGRRGSTAITTTCGPHSTGSRRPIRTRRSSWRARSAGSGSRAGYLARGRRTLAGRRSPRRPRTAESGRGRSRRPGALAARSGMVDEGRLRLEEASPDVEGARRPGGAAAALEALGWLSRLRRRRQRGVARGLRGGASTRRQLGDAAARRERSSASARCSSRSARRARRGPLARTPRARGRRSRGRGTSRYHFLADCALIRGDCAEAESALPGKPSRRARRSATSSRQASRCRVSRWRRRARANRPRDRPRGRGRGALALARPVALDRLLGRAARALPRPARAALGDERRTSAPRARARRSTTPSSSRWATLSRCENVSCARTGGRSSVGERGHAWINHGRLRAYALRERYSAAFAGARKRHNQTLCSRPCHLSRMGFGRPRTHPRPGSGWWKLCTTNCSGHPRKRKSFSSHPLRVT